MEAILKEKIFDIPEEEIIFDSFTKFSFLLYRIVLIRFEPLASNATSKSRLVYAAKMFIAIIPLSCMLATITQALIYAATTDNFLEATRDVLDALAVLLILLKAFIPFLRKEKIWQFREEMNELFDARKDQKRIYKIKPYLDGYQRIVKASASFFAAILLPVFYTILPYLIDGTMKLSAPFWFPFDPFQFETFPLASLWIDYSAVTGTLLLLASDTLMYALVTALSMELDIVKVEFENLPSRPKSERKDKINFLLERHSQLLKLSDKLRDIYSPTCLACFVITSIILCICLFQLSTGDNDTAAYMLYIPYLSIFLSQIYGL